MMKKNDFTYRPRHEKSKSYSLQRVHFYYKKTCYVRVSKALYASVENANQRNARFMNKRWDAFMR